MILQIIDRSLTWLYPMDTLDTGGDKVLCQRINISMAHVAVIASLISRHKLNASPLARSPHRNNVIVDTHLRLDY